MSRTPRRILLALLVAVLGVSVGAVASSARSDRGGRTGEDRKGGRAGDDHGRGHRPDVYEIPGDAVFPEGIALDPRGKGFFVSSTTDGTIFRGDAGRTALTPFAAGGADGRTTATGMKVDGRGRLLVAGAATGKAFVLSTDDGSTLKVLDSRPGPSQTFINDVAVTPGFAYFTDSLRPVILRAATSGASVGELEPWLDLRGTPFVYQDGFNANGIVSFDDGRLLVVVQSNTGKLFRIDTRTKAVGEIDLGGKTVTNGDGLVARGSRLFVVRNSDNEIVVVKLRRDKRAGRVGKAITSDAFAFPTTAALDGKRLLVVNSQFDRRGGTPVLPFTVAAVRRP